MELFKAAGHWKLCPGRGGHLHERQAVGAGMAEPASNQVVAVLGAEKSPSLLPSDHAVVPSNQQGTLVTIHTLVTVLIKAIIMMSSLPHTLGVIVLPIACNVDKAIVMCAGVSAYWY